MKKASRFVVLIAALALAAPLFAQQSQTQAKPQQPPQNPAASVPTANPDDVKSVDAILGALYDVISGPPGPRDWKRFRSLFIPEARLIPSGLDEKGEWHMRAMSPDDYEKRAGEFFKKEGFFERGISNKVEQYGTIAHVFSTYESRHEKDAKPFARGINSIQLVFDGKRWYVVTILWQQETPQFPVPEKYVTK